MNHALLSAPEQDVAEIGRDGRRQRVDAQLRIMRPAAPAVPIFRAVVDEQQQAGHLEQAGHVDGDAGALVVLLVGAQDDQQRVGDRDREQRLLRRPVGVMHEQRPFEPARQFGVAAGQQFVAVAL